MLSCLFYVLFVFLADCGLQNLLALHDADVDDKACNLVECDACLLDTSLHLPLIERSARGSALTEAGRVLYKRAQGILELSELTRKEMLAMASGFTGTLHILSLIHIWKQDSRNPGYIPVRHSQFRP